MSLKVKVLTEVLSFTAVLLNLYVCTHTFIRTAYVEYEGKMAKIIDNVMLATDGT